MRRTQVGCVTAVRYAVVNDLTSGKIQSGTTGSFSGSPMTGPARLNQTIFKLILWALHGASGSRSRDCSDGPPTDLRRKSGVLALSHDKDLGRLVLPLQIELGQSVEDHAGVREIAVDCGPC